MTLDRREFMKFAGGAAFGIVVKQEPRDFNVKNFGAIGDGIAVDTSAIQKAIDTAGAWGGGARVLLPGGKRYLIGSLMLKSGIDFHLAEDTRLIASPNPLHYPSALAAILMAEKAVGLKISGSGYIDGQAMKFMSAYSETDERWEPKPFRPRMFRLTACSDLEISGISFGNSPEWGLYMLGCERILVDGITIRNQFDVPNCDGIDPDRCRDLEIRNCDIECADDAIVIKASEQAVDYGPTRNVVVKDCKMKSRDSGIKIGTETAGDISNVRFERCKVINGGRGPTITHRGGGEIHDIEFSDIEVTAEHHAARWWGWGEAVSLTVRSRVLGKKVGRLHDIRIRNVRGKAENSVRVEGTKDNPIENVLLDNVDITIDRWTKYPGGKFDNRSTSADVPGLEPHATPVYSIRNADHVLLRDCKARWGTNIQDYFGCAVEAENVRDLALTRFSGEAAHPERDEAVTVKP
jgi:hypothetical protein